MTKARAPQNRTLSCDEQELDELSRRSARLVAPATPEELRDVVLNQDLFEAAAFLPNRFVDLLLLDPPYNISKNFHGNPFREMDGDDYRAWFDSVLTTVMPTLKPNGSVYVCSDWKTSMLIAPLLERHLHVRNRITWEREKGRGAAANWKNSSEDVWFCTMSNDYHFDVEAVKLKRRVIAPYRDQSGEPKDWEQGSDGKYRLTHPSNLWTDITVPFWSMPENTDHPAQKPEKLVAKLILASTAPDALVFDPFLGSGTSAVVARKLGRRFLGVEHNAEYCCWAQKRLQAAEDDRSVQGYANGVFWERNAQRSSKPAGIPGDAEHACGLRA